eukprot:1899921-Prorocentrum_lima.AAC.1
MPHRRWGPIAVGGADLLEPKSVAASGIAAGAADGGNGMEAKPARSQKSPPMHPGRWSVSSLLVRG